MARFSGSKAFELLIECLDYNDSEDDKDNAPVQNKDNSKSSVTENTGLSEIVEASVQPEIDIQTVLKIRDELTLDKSDSELTESEDNNDDTLKDPDFNLSSFLRQSASFNDDDEDDDNDSQSFIPVGKVLISSSPKTHIDRPQCSKTVDILLHNAEYSNTSTVDRPLEQISETSTSITTTINDDQNLIRQHEQRPKKRKRKPETWGKNLRKASRIGGQEYVGVTGKTVAAKSIGEPCTCRKKCFDKLGGDQIKKLFQEFYKLGSEDVQDSFLFGCIKSSAPKRRRQRKENSKKRNSTFSYLVKNDTNEDVEVCRQAFMSIFAIGKTRFERIRTDASTPPLSKRGLHGNQPRKGNEIIQQIHSHIQSFPRRSSHYSRNKNQGKVFLQEELNINRMYKLYLEKFEPGSEKPCVKYDFYKHILNTEYNIGFGNPRSDTCLKCDQLDQLIKSEPNADARKKLESERRLHHAKAESGYKLLGSKQKEAESDPNIDAYTFDFQQNLPSPNLTTSVVFYKRLLWTYNFGIHDLRTGDGIMNIWCEGTAGRGAAEVCSCLRKVLKDRARNAKHLFLFSDGCAGQNKNRGMVAFLQSLIESNSYERIDHVFLFRGHTFLPNDRDFALIEKRKRVERAMIPSDYIKIIEGSRESRPFIVNSIQTNDIIDYMKCANDCLPKSFKSTDGEQLKFSDVHWFSYGQSEESDLTHTTSNIISHQKELWCRYTVNDIEPWKKVPLFKRGVKCIAETELKYNGPQKIKDAKLKDLLGLCDDGLVCEDARAFYYNLKGGAEHNNDNDNIGDDDDYDD